MEAAFRTVLLLVLRLDGLWATDLWVLVEVVLRTFLFVVLLTGFLYVVVLLVTVVLRGVCVTVRLVVVLRCGVLTDVDRWATLRLFTDFV